MITFRPVRLVFSAQNRRPAPHPQKWSIKASSDLPRTFPRTPPQMFKHLPSKASLMPDGFERPIQGGPDAKWTMKMPKITHFVPSVNDWLCLFYFYWHTRRLAGREIIDGLAALNANKLGFWTGINHGLFKSWQVMYCGSTPVPLHPSLLFECLVRLWH